MGGGDARSAAAAAAPGIVERIGAGFLAAVCFVGDVSLFAGALARRLPWRRRGSLLWPCLYQVGVLSIPVVLVTGGFIGMVLAAQTYDQLRVMHLEATVGSVVSLAVVKELGPTLAATMLAGRVGSAMAAELGTMRVTEQIDALRMLGADPIHHLVVPRFLACFLLIPMLTILSDVAGILGGWFLSTQVMGILSSHYWRHAEGFVTVLDVLTGLFKSMWFGAAIAVVACHRGFHCDGGAEGVGQAATEAFVYSFVSILALDFVLGIALTDVEHLLRAMQVPLG